MSFANLRMGLEIDMSNEYIHGQALGSDIFIAFLYDNFFAELRGHLILLHFLKAIFRPSVKFAGSLDFIAFLNDNFLALRRDGVGRLPPLAHV